MKHIDSGMAIILCLLSVMATGCGTYRTHHSKDFIRTETEYRSQEKKLSGIGFYQFRFDGRNVYFSIEEEYAIPEYKYDLYKAGVRTSKDPDLIHILNPMSYVFALLFMDGDFVENFGYPGKWRYTEVKENAVQVGSKGERRYSPSYKTVDVSLNDSRWKSAETDCDGYRCKIDIGRVAEQLTVKPETLNVRMRVVKKNCTTEAKFNYDAEEVSAMRLDSADWDLPVDKRLHKYLVAIKEKTRAQDHEGALSYFENVEMLGVSLPPSFDFQYGKTLVNAGYEKDGRDRLDRYLSVTGDTGKYCQEANSLMDSLDK